MRALVILLLLPPIVPPAVARGNVSSEFTGPTLVFKLTVANPDRETRHLTKVGVRSRAQGSFECLTDSAVLLSLADYPVSFPVEREETLIDADPKLGLAPGSSAVFTVSLYPNAAGACGPWSSEVSVIAVFDDGTRLETKPEIIDEHHVEALRARDPQRDEVLQALAHRNVDLRLQSLRQLGRIGVDRLTLETKIRLALRDPDRRVRAEAYRQAGAFNLQALQPDLLARFDVIALPGAPAELRQANSVELLELSRTFMSLRATGAEDRLLATLTHPNFLYPEALGAALLKIRTPAMPGKLMQSLSAHRSWASVSPGSADRQKLAARYDILLEALIEYRDVSSVRLLKSLMARPENKRTAHVIMNHVLALTDPMHRVQDPFVLAFGDVAEHFANDQWGDARRNLREPAMLLRVRTSDESEEQMALLRAGLRDPSPHVQVAAAREASALALASLVPEIQESHGKAEGSFRPHFCSALAALDARCETQGESP